VDLLLSHAYFLAEDPAERQVMKPYPPLGLLYVSSHLKRQGFDVSVFDGTFQTPGDFAARLERDRPPLVGFYANLMTKRTVLSLLPECRRIGALTILGGPDPPHYAEEYLQHGADFVVVGEGERTLQELMPRLLARPGCRDLADVPGLVYRDESGRLVRTAPRPLLPDLDAQPFPDREAIDIGAYLTAWRGRHGVGSVSLITARGCPYTCSWCSRSVFGETHRRRSAGNVADEVQLILDRYHPDMLWYADDVFTIHPGFLAAYAAEMDRRGLKVPFECISRAERISEPVADLLARLGCSRLWIGSESGSQRVLDAMDRRVTAEQVRRATRLLQSRGIQVGMFIMLGYDGEEQTDLEATVDHLKRAAPDVFLTTVAYPIKGTPYFERVNGRVLQHKPWASTTDRELGVSGRPSRRYYQFARRWMTSEVARDRHWRGGRYLRAARAAVSAGAGRLGMALTCGERES
jgi:anaerobic magnesium-protoporphyrin IX monomethyl ester cyclase